MEKLGYDEVRIDPMGNLIGRIGEGPRVIAIDGHIDRSIREPDALENEPIQPRDERRRHLRTRNQ